MVRVLSRKIDEDAREETCSDVANGRCGRIVDYCTTFVRCYTDRRQSECLRALED